MPAFPGATRLLPCFAFLLVVALSGRSRAAPPDGGPARPPLLLRLGHIQPESHPYHRAALRFARELERLSGSALQVEIFADGAVGDERDLLETLQMGSLDFIAVSSSLTGKFDDSFDVFSLPFLFGSLEHELQVLDDASLRDRLSARLIPRRIHPIAFWAGGAREYYGTAPIRGLADFAGKRVRTIDDPVIVETWSALGARPSPLAFASIGPALQNHLVDGVEGTLDAYVAKRFDRLAPEVALLHAVYAVELLHIAESTWEKLSPPQRAWVLEAARLASQYQRSLLLEQEHLREGTLAALHVHVSRPDPAPLREAVKPVYDHFRQRRTREAWRLVESIRRLLPN